MSTILDKFSMYYKGKGSIRKCIMNKSNLVTRLRAVKLELFDDVLVRLGKVY